jgi:hypothetical protein
MDADRHRSHSTTRKEHLFDILFVEYRGTEFLDEVARLFDGGDCNENENRNESSTERSSSVENDVDFEKKRPMSFRSVCARCVHTTETSRWCPPKATLSCLPETAWDSWTVAWTTP